MFTLRLVLLEWQKNKWICLYLCTLTSHVINLCCHVYAGGKNKKREEEKSCCRLGRCRARARRKLSAQIAFLELIISFYVIHLSVVIVCQSNAVAARCEVECKFCLGNSSLCTKKKIKKEKVRPHCRIYIYNYSHDAIISHHNSSAQDVGADGGAFTRCIPNGRPPARRRVRHRLLVPLLPVVGSFWRPCNKTPSFDQEPPFLQCAGGAEARTQNPK